MDRPLPTRPASAVPGVIAGVIAGAIAGDAAGVPARALALGLLAVLPLAGCGDGGGASSTETTGQATSGAGPAAGGAETFDGPPLSGELTPRTPSDEPLAELDCAEDRHEFGRVWAGDEVVHEFRFTAAGSVPLVINDYRSDCGCTVASLEIVHPDGAREEYELKTALAPGTELALAARFDTTNREGRQSKSVHVYGNIPGGVREVGFAADIQPVLRVEPSVFVVDPMSVLDRREASWSVVGVAGEPFLLSPLDVGLPEELVVSATPADPGGPTAEGKSVRWDVHAVLNPGMPKGHRNYEIRLQTDIQTDRPPEPDGTRPAFVGKARVSAVIAGLVSLDTQNLNFGMVARDEVVARTVTLASHDPGFALPEPKWEVKPHKEGASVAFADTLQVTTRRAENGTDWEIELLLDGLSADVPRSFYGRMVIETGHPTEKRLELVLSGLKRGS